MPDSLSVAAPSGYEFFDPLDKLAPTDIIYRFKQFFQCSIPECGDIVCISGDAELVPNRKHSRSEDSYVYQLFPVAVHRGLPIISLPVETPDSVRAELETAFKLFWIDLGSCANKMRISVERALDELGVAASRQLNDRIKKFEAIDASHAETFHALREVGNVGSHQGDNTRETVLDAWEVYEDALRDLFGGHKSRITALKAKIRASKGR
ncbi:DUF4145 domain-containing protein [Bradyrhizobium sp. B024]|uniref:DUF4145 domain-containing protein n=1 Tax=Bradyrhizobium sp. B024 TaxID=3140247 RepID=UPI0031838DDC